MFKSVMYTKLVVVFTAALLALILNVASSSPDEAHASLSKTLTHSFETFKANQ